MRVLSLSAIYPEHFSREQLLRSEIADEYNIINKPGDRLTEINLTRLAFFLESLRSKLTKRFKKDTPIYISSGFRSEELNNHKRIRGSKTSYHTLGLAADITVRGMSSLDLARFVRDNMVEEGFDQVINEYNAWVHVSIAKEPGRPRSECLTAFKLNKKTKYAIGLSDAQTVANLHG